MASILTDIYIGFMASILTDIYIGFMASILTDFKSIQQRRRMRTFTGLNRVKQKIIAY